MKNNTYIITGIILLFSLMLFTVFQKKPPFWDETYYIENIINLNKFGFSKQYLIDYKGPAGPTYTLIHYLLQDITKLSAPLIRIPNIIFLIAILFYIKKIFNLNNTKNNSLVFAISSLSIANIYTISGLVLTEIFAVFFMTFTVYYLIKHYKNNKNNYILAVISGLSFSLAILGRQPIIVLWIALPFLFIKKGYLFKFDFSKKEFIKFLTVTLITSLIIPFYVFYLWGNIQPLSQASTGIGISIKNLVLAFAYAGIFTFFIKPNYFNFLLWKKNLYEFIIVLIISIFFNIFFLKIEFIPFNNIIINYLNPSLFPYYEIFCGNILSVVGFSFIYFFIKKNLLQKDPLTMFFAFGFLLIIGTSLKVTHQFSARYVAQAFPLMVLSIHITKKENINYLSIVTLAIGGVLGIISLNSYY